MKSSMNLVYYIQMTLIKKNSHFLHRFAITLDVECAYKIAYCPER